MRRPYRDSAALGRLVESARKAGLDAVEEPGTARDGPMAQRPTRFAASRLGRVARSGVPWPRPIDARYVLGSRRCLVARFLAVVGFGAAVGLAGAGVLEPGVPRIPDDPRSAD